jgi:hypothetical protein
MKTIKSFEKMIVIAIAILATPMHELGHWIGYTLDGIPAVLHYHYTEPLTDTFSLMGVSGGPLMSLVLAIFGLCMMYINRSNKSIWAYFSVIMCLTRLIPYLFLVIPPNNLSFNDEGIIAMELGLPIWVIYSIFVTLFASILFAIYSEYNGTFFQQIKIYKYGYILYVLSIIVFGIRVI